MTNFQFSIFIRFNGGSLSQAAPRQKVRGAPAKARRQ
jgi:hypothetical protein